MIAGATYIYEKDLFSNGLEAITVSTNGKKLPIYRVNTDKPMVALSFDDAWGNEDTQKILDILKKYKINVTFFMTGGWVESYPDDVKAIKAAGHDLGNHSEHHKHMPQLNNSSICDELNSVTEKVEKLTNTKMCLSVHLTVTTTMPLLNRRKIVATTQSNGMLTLLTGKIMALNQL